MSLGALSDTYAENSLGRTLENFLNTIESTIVFFGLMFSIGLATVQCLYRYIIVYLSDEPSSIIWLEELARFVFVWTSYLAISITIRNRESIRMGILVDALPERGQQIAAIASDILFLVFASYIGYLGTNQIQMLIRLPQIAQALQIPYFIPYLILPVGFGLIVLRLVQRLVTDIPLMSRTDVAIGAAIAFACLFPVQFYSDMEASKLLFIYFPLFLIMGVPIAVCLGLTSLVTVLGSDALPLQYVAQTAFTSIDSFPIMAIPFFITAGVLMGAGGLSKRLLDLADELVGSMYGGIALATISTCVFFGAISGSGPATVAAIGSLTIPAMIERGYDKYFSCAVVAAAGAIGVMIPPSNPFVVYGIAAQESIGRLFMGGIAPGLLTGFALMLYSYLYSRKKGWRGETQKFSFDRLGKAFWNAKWGLMVPVIILGGIYGGIMTPTESAAVAAVYGLVVGVWVYKEISLQGLVKAGIEAASTSGMIIMLIAMATIFGNLMAIEQIPDVIARAILSFSSNKIVILLLINVLLLLTGMFMEALAAIVILVPILLPIVVKLGVDPVHFGIIMVVNLAIGFVTPPIGVNLFVASSVAGVKLEPVAKVATPLIAVMLAVLLLITFVPAIPMFLAQK
ncbi:MAG: TRAP transporter large permease subunit [Halodesulfovibrio sp.]|uniref:TRAP transporter large permease n=1 Tax=Halodesulfovibrio sp. TaxID=1912772 RepID=UPI00359DED43